MRVSVKPPALRANACALEGGACIATTGAALSARMEFTVELFPTPVFPARMPNVYTEAWVARSDDAHLGAGLCMDPPVSGLAIASTCLPGSKRAIC